MRGRRSKRDRVREDGFAVQAAPASVVSFNALEVELNQFWRAGYIDGCHELFELSQIVHVSVEYSLRGEK
jgi:hypothetical protein